MKEITIETRFPFEMVDITEDVRTFLKEQETQKGICAIFVPHTTAAVTINENADPDVPEDIMTALDTLIPLNNNYRHQEGNSAAHIKASLIGASETILINEGALVLGTWQSIFFCEFDGPRKRKVIITIIE